MHTRMMSGWNLAAAGCTTRWKVLSAASCPEPTAANIAVNVSFCMAIHGGTHGLKPSLTPVVSWHEMVIFQRGTLKERLLGLTWQRHIDGVAIPCALPRLIHMPAARPHLVLMYVNEQHRVIIVEQILQPECCLQDGDNETVRQWRHLCG